MIGTKANGTAPYAQKDDKNKEVRWNHIVCIMTPQSICFRTSTHQLILSLFVVQITDLSRRSTSAYKVKCTWFRLEYTLKTGQTVSFTVSRVYVGPSCSFGVNPSNW